MDFSKIDNYMKFTDDPMEMIELGHRIMQDLSDIYTPLMIEKMYADINDYIPNESSKRKEQILYRAIYDYWAYGSNVSQEFYLHFGEFSHREKKEYLVGRLRNIYIDHLNNGGGEEMKSLLGDKYKLYQLLKPYYLRDVIEIQEEKHYPIFQEFVNKHPVFVVKPGDYFCGIGVHKVSMDDYRNDTRVAFESILEEGKAIKKRHPSRESKMVLEELIVQDVKLEQLHPSSVNAIRATAVRGKDGKIHLFHPWIKVGVNDTFVASAALNGFDAEVDPATGVVITDGYQENGNVYTLHPNSGIQIKGYQIPKWDDMLSMVDELMEALPQYGYIGWDLVLTPKGWCVMEGNYSGDFTFQLINGRGFKKEFEDLIGWRFDKDFWWQASSASI